MQKSGLPIKVFFCIVFAAGISLRAEVRTDQSEKPNFLIIITDDQRWDGAGYAGNPIIHTPNMDKLASEGSFFTNAFVTTPICAASRASILTGMYERSHAYTFGTPPLREKLIKISYPAVLKDNGYDVGYIGKLGVNFENQADTSLFDYYRPQDWGDYYYKLTEDSHSHRHVTDTKGDQAIEYLNSRSDEEPFCLTISFNAPHAEDQSVRQFIWPVELDSLYVNDSIPKPVMHESRWFEAQPDFVQKGMNRIRWHWRFDTEKKYQDMVKGYYRMITGVDYVMGRVLNEIKTRGLDENTIVIFIGDNGFFLGERGFAGKWLLYEQSLHVPMIVYNPMEKKSQGREIDALALNIDLAPTIFSYAGINIPGKVQGRSLLPVLKGDMNSWRSEFFCEHLFEHKDIPQSEGIRSIEWKYFRYREHKDHEELYKLSEDPNEMYNLADDIKHQEQLRVLREKCNAQIIKLEKEAR